MVLTSLLFLASSCHFLPIQPPPLISFLLRSKLFILSRVPQFSLGSSGLRGFAPFALSVCISRLTAIVMPFSSQRHLAYLLRSMFNEGNNESDLLRSRWMSVENVSCCLNFILSFVHLNSYRILTFLHCIQEYSTLNSYIRKLPLYPYIPLFSTAIHDSENAYSSISAVAHIVILQYCGGVFFFSCLWIFKAIFFEISTKPQMTNEN